MATIPDTPDIARALDSVQVDTVDDATRIQAARERLLILHQLGETEEHANLTLRARVRLWLNLNATRGPPPKFIPRRLIGSKR